MANWTIIPGEDWLNELAMAWALPPAEELFPAALTALTVTGASAHPAEARVTACSR
jgi:hypothetical protein